jgi:hypothetical protein
MVAHSVHPASLMNSCAAPHANPQLLHHVLLASKQLLIKYGPLEENETPREKLINSMPGSIQP